MLTLQQERSPESTTAGDATDNAKFDDSTQGGQKTAQVKDSVGIEKQVSKKKEDAAGKIDKIGIEEWRRILMGESFVLHRPSRSSIDYVPKDFSVRQIGF